MSWAMCWQNIELHGRVRYPPLQNVSWTDAKSIQVLLVAEYQLWIFELALRLHMNSSLKLVFVVLTVLVLLRHVKTGKDRTDLLVPLLEKWATWSWPATRLGCEVVKGALQLVLPQVGLSLLQLVCIIFSDVDFGLWLNAFNHLTLARSAPLTRVWTLVSIREDLL